jgi:hypothetical protein
MRGVLSAAGVMEHRMYTCYVTVRVPRHVPRGQAGLLNISI